MNIILILVVLTVFAVAVTILISGFSGAVWVPAFTKDTSAMLKILKLKPGMQVYEFGCGDGRFLRKVAKYNVKATGFEINPFICKLAQILCRQKNIKVIRGNAWNKSFASADMVFAFLMPKFMEKLGTKLKSELRPETIVVTYIFPIPNMKHYKHAHNCYFYKV